MIVKHKMKLLLTTSLFLISAASIVTAQNSNPQKFLTRAQIKESERRLADMGYWTGAVDGLFDSATRSALIAFQKWEGRAITGRLNLEELDAVRTGTAPKAKDLGYEHMEIDLDRQVLLLVNAQGGVRILPASTGTGKPFIEDGQTSIAYTPRGRFVVYDKSIGWEKGYLGSMYYSNYISGGVAIHGHPNVPIQAASHGCIRIPMFAAREVSKLLPLGTIVLVYDKVSFVSAKDWVENPQLKQSVLLESIFAEYKYQAKKTATSDLTKTGSKSSTLKKVPSRTTRAGFAN